MIRVILKIFISVIAILVIYFILNLEKSGERKLGSIALTSLIEYCEILISVEAKLEIMMWENEHDKLVFNHIRPAADEIISLKEEMDEVESKVKESALDLKNIVMPIKSKLEKMQKDILSWETQYRKTGKLIDKQWRSISNKIYQFDSGYHYLESLQLSLKPWRIYFYPAEENLNPASAEPALLQDMTNLLKNKLLPLVKAFEKAKIEKSEAPFFEEDDDRKVELKSIWDNVQSILDVESQQFQRMGHLLSAKINQILNMAQLTNKLDRSKTEMIALKFVKLESDIVMLNEKVKNIFHLKKIDEL